MIRSMTVAGFLFITCAAYSQGFPNAEKQPRFKESRSRNKHYSKQAYRRHVKRGTALIEFNVTPCPQAVVCVPADKRISVYAI